MKRMFIFVFVGLLLLSTAVANASELKCSSWANENINMANKAGIIPKEQYMGDYTLPIERYRIAELIANAYENVTGSEYKAKNAPFTDIYNESVATVYELGIMNGKSETEFAPYDNTTRQEMAKIILTFKSAVEGKELVLPTAVLTDFTDFNMLGEWAKPYVAKASEEGIIKGYEDGRFGGTDTVSWEVAITLITRACELTEKAVPVITSVEDGSIVSSGGFNVGVECDGSANVYVQGFSAHYPDNIGVCRNGSEVKAGRLIENYMYYIFAECEGVFSEPVCVYTDKYDLFVKIPDYATAGNLRINWNRVPGVELYTVKVTENRNSYYEGDIAPNVPQVYEVRYEDFLNITTNPNRLYNVEITGGEYMAIEDVYIDGVYFADAGEISANYPQSQEEAEKLMTSVTVPVWRLQGNRKVSSTATFTVHYMIADKVKLVFEEIYNGPEQFPIKDVGGYAWRGGRSEHNGGTAIDINYNENYCIYKNGTVIGEYWKPYEDPYSITPYGDVIKAFEKYGFTWGGDAWSNPKDYMHFSYLGT